MSVSSTAASMVEAEGVATATMTSTSSATRSAPIWFRLDWSAWALAGITGLCFGLLSLHHRPLAFPPWLFGDIAGLHTLGNWLGFALVTGLLILFVTRISHNMRRSAARLADLRQQASEEEHIVRMGLLASGAAHELGTPLASLSVILSDWRRVPKLRDDAELIGEIA